MRRRPCSLDLPYSAWTLQRLADELAEQTGIRVEKETVRVLVRCAPLTCSLIQGRRSAGVRVRELIESGYGLHKGEGEWLVVGRCVVLILVLLLHPSRDPCIRQEGGL